MPLLRARWTPASPTSPTHARLSSEGAPFRAPTISPNYDQFNYLHPFREGNGRTQRIFCSRVVRDAGYDLDWRDVPGEVNKAACHTAATGDLSPLVTMFDTLVTQLP